MKAAITEIILEPSLSGFIMTQNAGSRGGGEGSGVGGDRGGVETLCTSSQAYSVVGPSYSQVQPGFLVLN